MAGRCGWNRLPAEGPFRSSCHSSVAPVGSSLYEGAQRRGFPC
jgi:hypothetical protein